jgi:hypothetical protein
MNQEIKFNCDRNKDNLLDYLLVKTAPVLTGIKPAILLRLCKCRHIRKMTHYESFCIHQDEIIKLLNLECLVMKNDGRDIQVMFYDPQVMSETLQQEAVVAFLGEQGYSEPGNTDKTLEQLKLRFSSHCFPHEIGIFLGYPLKDVKGYMDRKEIAVKLAKARWRVFGDPAESLRLMNQYRTAEKAAQLILSAGNSIRNSIQLLKQINKLDQYIFE